MTPSQRKKVHEALVRVNPTVADFDTFYYLAFGEPRAQKIADGTIEYMAMHLMMLANAQNFLPLLLDSLADQRAGSDPDLTQLRKDVDTELPISVTGKMVLEKIVDPLIPLLDPKPLLDALLRLEPVVGRIEYSDDNGAVKKLGTGFMVGKDLVMTNYHVIEPFVKGKSARGLGIRFGYAAAVSGIGVEEGEVCSIIDDPNWCVAWSPYNLPIDETAEPKVAEPSAEELDFALLRLSRSAGSDVIAGGRTRGWILNSQFGTAALEASTDAHILQHPSGGPMKLAFGFGDVLWTKPGGTRFGYRTNTENGSSGSPIFDKLWNLVGLHHLGDPDASLKKPATYNQGIPIRAILDYLDRRGLRGLVG